MRFKVSSHCSSRRFCTVCLHASTRSLSLANRVVSCIHSPGICGRKNTLVSGHAWRAMESPLHATPRRRNGNRKSVIAFGIIFTMLLLDTSLVIIDVNNAIREITMTILSDSSQSLTDRYNNLVLPWPVESAVYAFMVSVQFLPFSVNQADRLPARPNSLIWATSSSVRSPFGVFI